MMVWPVPQIVVVDDSPTSISLYELSTEPLSVELHAFRSPLDSLLHLGEHRADLLFLDIIMREMDGLTLLKKLRDMELHRATPVVIVTSKDYAQDRSTARQLGALDFLVKPLRSQEIREIIRKHTGAEERVRGEPRGDGAGAVASDRGARSDGGPGLDETAGNAHRCGGDDRITPTRG